MEARLFNHLLMRNLSSNEETFHDPLSTASGADVSILLTVAMFTTVYDFIKLYFSNLTGSSSTDQLMTNVLDFFSILKIQSWKSQMSFVSKMCFQIFSWKTENFWAECERNYFGRQMKQLSQQQQWTFIMSEWATHGREKHRRRLSGGCQRL